MRDGFDWWARINNFLFFKKKLLLVFVCLYLVYREREERSVENEIWSVKNGVWQSVSGKIKDLEARKYYFKEGRELRRPPRFFDPWFFRWGLGWLSRRDLGSLFSLGSFLKRVTLGLRKLPLCQKTSIQPKCWRKQTKNRGSGQEDEVQKSDAGRAGSQIRTRSSEAWRRKSKKI